MIKSLLKTLLWLWNITKGFLLMNWRRSFISTSSISNSDVFKSATEKDVDVLKKDTPVVFFLEHMCGGGYVEWTGARTFDDSYTLVVIRLIEDVEGSTNGTFEGQALGKEPDSNYFMVARPFVSLAPEFRDGDYCVVRPYRKKASEGSGFVKKSHDFSYILYPLDSSRGLPKVVLSFQLQKAPPPVSDERSDAAPPISADQLDRFCGRNKGIQGRCNSCYLDTLLFSLFTFSDVLLDDLMDKERSGSVGDAFHTAFSCLRYQIVYPLRASHFVSDEHVDFLRRFIAKETGKEQFEGETRDIPECMDALFGKILNWTPQLEIGDSNSQDLVFFESFTTELLSSDNNTILTTNQMLEFSALTMNFCYKKVPRLLMLQLPRNLDKTVDMIPSLEIDLKLLLHSSVKECFSCDRNATLQFPQLAADSGLAKSFLCRSCASNHDLNEAAARQLPEAPVPDGEEPDTRLMLTAVLCIERSHYNCFARCADSWVFFDSMSDQEELVDPVTLEKVKFNVPLVEEVKQFVSWIEEATVIAKRETNSLEHFYQNLSTEEDRERAKRLFHSPYMALYSRLPRPKFSVPT